MSSPVTLQNSSKSTQNSSNVDLSPQQARAVALLAQGYSITHAAADVGVHRTTIHGWLRSVASFQAALKEARKEFAEQLRDDLRDLSDAALDTLRALLAAEDTPPAVRLKAALAVLERPGFPDPGWNLPERIESPRQQFVVDGMADMEAEYRRLRAGEKAERLERA